ncbi:MAG: hypothetical protein ACYDBQ_01640 [Thermoplasmatota archaeon]
MGTQAEGLLTVGGKEVPVSADFASDHVTFYGSRRGEVPYTAIEVVGVQSGRLRLRVDGAVMEFRLGDAANRIAQRIRKPPGRLDKVGVPKGATYTILGRTDRKLSGELQEHGAVPGGDDARLVFFAVTQADELEILPSLKERLPEDGALWVIYRKGGKGVQESDVLSQGRDAGLKDVKMVRFTATHTAVKFVPLWPTG